MTFEHDEEESLVHYGTPRHSGRYPWGSGGDPYQRASSFLGYVKELREAGMSEVDIAKGLGLTTSQLRAQRHMAGKEKRSADVAMALRLKDKGMSNVAIGVRMGVNESTVRSLLKPALQERASITTSTAEALRTALGDGYLDVGSGVEARLGVTRTALNNAVAILQEEGYSVHTIRVKQLGTDKFTNVKVLAPPNTSFADISQNRDKIHLPDRYSEDKGRNFLGLEPVQSIDGKRVLIRYDTEGGGEMDGVLELRPGVDDLNLGGSRYAQVRVAVDGAHFMKGMAIYGRNDFPPGIDIIYNTKKPLGTPKEEVFKSVAEDPDNPFVTTVRQRHYRDSNGELQLSPINLVGYTEGAGEEGFWSTWSRNLSSQILSKQSPILAKKQLDLAYELQREELEEIMTITNPAVKKLLLQSLADGAETAAVHLKAAALPRQGNHVLLPINSLEDGEVFAPNFHDGELVTLFRHPHGGIFEAPTLRVNNRNPEGREIIGTSAKDAIGINSKVAARLSGADFDGDTVVVIPNNNRVLKTAPPIESLLNFDPRISYRGNGTPTISGQTKQIEMGKITNLITDMTIKGATTEEIARAVRHSMVVIDAEKHKLNYRQSFVDNGISALKEKYQGRSDSGATTIISRAKAKVRVPERREGKLVTDPVTGKKTRVFIDPATGDSLYEETGRTVVDRFGRVIPRTTKIPRMLTVRDAARLSSGTVIESVYVEHANRLKDLARKARRAILDTEDTPYSQSANKVYSGEVQSLREKLAMVMRNKPLERQAQLLANAIIRMKKAANPGMEPPVLKKLKGQALEESRTRVGAKKPIIALTDREWHAIQAGAISRTMLDSILQNSDMRQIRLRALPPNSRRGLSPVRVMRAKSMIALGNTRADVAAALGISLTTLDRALEEE